MEILSRRRLQVGTTSGKIVAEEKKQTAQGGKKMHRYRTKPVNRKHLFYWGLLIFILVAVVVGCGKAPQDKPAETTTAVEDKAKTAPSVTRSTGNIAQVSDVHFNPFYDETLFEKLKTSPAGQWESIFSSSKIKDVGTYGDFNYETDYPLLLSTFKHLAANTKVLDFIIFTGDFLAHKFHERYGKVNNNSTDGLDSFIDKTLTFFVILFEKYFPEVPVYFCLGNNDSYSGDYDVVPEGDFLKKTAVLFAGSLLQHPDNRESFKKTYPIGGYYSIIPPKSSGTRIISLNANFFSRKYKTSFDKYDPGEKELDWLEVQLQAAKEKKEKVWLLLHIPPGTDVFTTLKDKTYTADWVTAYNTRFIEMLTDFAGVITVGFAGHTHADDFRLLLRKTEAGQQALAFLHICPGIDSLFGNNPGFETLTYNRQDFSLIDYRVYYLDLQKIAAGDKTTLKWAKEYVFSETYKQDVITPATLSAVYSSIKDDPALRTYYMNYYDVNHKKALTDENWQAYWCGIAQWTQAGFESCNK
jgi:predicted MPP superfamily phosphohydrolase